jgi:hypothetical protein
MSEAARHHAPAAPTALRSRGAVCERTQGQANEPAATRDTHIATVRVPQSRYKKLRRFARCRLRADAARRGPRAPPSVRHPAHRTRARARTYVWRPGSHRCVAPTISAARAARRATVRNTACAAADHRPAQIGHRSLVTVRADLAHPQHRTSAPRCSLDTARALRTVRRLKTRRCAADRGERRSCRHCDSIRVRMAARSHHPCDLAEHQKQGGPQ